jgi:8-oxo-dGTP pyrophosphatase MutT (NUDIX family)
MTWHAAVIVLQKPDGQVLSVTRGKNLDDVNFPGGNRKLRDRSPADTARRELHEETGLVVRALQPLASWTLEGKRVAAFKGLTWSGRLRPSSEGQPAWVQPKRLQEPSSRFRRHNGMLLARL